MSRQRYNIIIIDITEMTKKKYNKQKKTSTQIENLDIISIHQ